MNNNFINVNNQRIGAENEGIITSFNVDITREQYLKFSLLFSNIVMNRSGKINAAVSQIFFAIMLNVFSFFSTGTLGYFGIVILVLAFIFFVYTLFFGKTAKINVISNANNRYSKSILTGKDFVGTIDVYANKIEKVSKHSTVSIDFENVLYIEDSDMLVFSLPTIPSIVVCTEYLTENQLEKIKNIVYSKTTMQKRRVVSPAVAAVYNPVILKEDLVDDTISVTVAYTEKEFTKLNIDTALYKYIARLPIYSAIALVTAAVFIFRFGFVSGIISFLSVLLVFLLAPIIKTYIMSKNVGKVMSQNLNYYIFYLSNTGVLVKTSWNDTEMGLLWDMVTKALNKKDSVEIYSKSSFVRIPKKSIRDFEKFEAIVEKNLKKQ